MIPHISLQEHLVHERLRQWQREAEQARILACLPQHRRLRHLVGHLGTFFVTLGARMQQLEQRDRPIISKRTRSEVPV
jgi:hypothetical protein